MRGALDVGQHGSSAFQLERISIALNHTRASSPGLSREALKQEHE
jgi:hypothetical protein